MTNAAIILAAAPGTNDFMNIGGILAKNDSDFEQTTYNFPMAVGDTHPKYLLMAKTPGSWGNGIEISTLVADDFSDSATLFGGKVNAGDVFEYDFSDESDGIGLVVRVDGDIVEVFIGNTEKDSKDFNNKSNYIVNLVNKSNYIRMVENDGTDLLPRSGYATLENGTNPNINNNSLITGYELFSNKEELDIDIVIGNELDFGTSAIDLADTREDCIAFVGTDYDLNVGLKSATILSNTLDERANGEYANSSMFAVLAGNYKYQYDRYNDKNRWVNLAGDIAGLRAQTNTNRASWWASAGLERGKIKNVIKLAFNPTQAQRDLLYKVGINPVVQFPGESPVMFGQKTLLNKPSSFDRVNVRGLFNTLERALSKMAKYQVMEFNDNFTRNRIVSMINPYLSTVKAGRGVQDFLVVCDETNNTPDVISRNQLVVDVYIKPTYVAEFIHLKFTNAGTNSFSSVIGG